MVVVVFSVCMPKHDSGVSFSKTALEFEGIRHAAVSVLSALAAVAMFAHNRHVKCYLWCRTVQYSTVQKVKLAKVTCHLLAISETFGRTAVCQFNAWVSIPRTLF